MVLMCVDEVINEYKVSENSICKMELTNKHINSSKDWTVIGLVGEVSHLSYSIILKTGRFTESMLAYRMRHIRYQKEHGYLMKEVLKYFVNLSFMDDVYKTFVKDKY